MKKFTVAVSLAAGLLLQSTVTYSGTRFSDPIVVSTNVAYGGLRAARQSSNTNEYIGCAVYGTTQSSYTTYVACSARNAAGKTFACSKYSPSYVLVQAALAVSGSSSVIINSDSAGNCTYIYGNNSSVNM